MISWTSREVTRLLSTINFWLNVFFCFQFFDEDNKVYIRSSGVLGCGRIVLGPTSGGGLTTDRAVGQLNYSMFAKMSTTQRLGF